MPSITITYTQHDLEQLILADIGRKLGDINVDVSSVTIEVKSQHNYKSEWESADFRATYRGQH